MPSEPRGNSPSGARVETVTDELRAALSSRYVIERELARGGSAVVYVARDVKHDRRVAIKVPRVEFLTKSTIERFHQEIGIASRLQHPNILPLFDSGEVDGRLFFVMPLVEGGSLRVRLKGAQQLELGVALQIAREVADALDYAHGLGILHRDVKPENILFSGDRAILADFGIARMTAGNHIITSDGVIVGTPAYMSPEQATGGNLTGRSDEYSLACVVYEMLAGTPPFAGPNAQAVMSRHSLDPVPSIRTVRSTVPLEAEQVIKRAMAKVAADRFATPGEFARELSRLLNDAISGRAPEPPRPRARVGPVVIGAGVLALAAGLWFTLGPGRRDDSSSTATERVPLLAVLPFEHLGSRDDSYFGRGLADEITSRLQGAPGLGVISPSSARQLAATAPAPEAGKTLGADYVLAATVRMDRTPAGGQARVIARLVRVASGRDVWTHAYDAALVPGQIITVQNSIAEAVAKAMGVTFAVRELALPARAPTTNSAAYDHYLRGVAMAANVYTAQSTRNAIDQFERATTLDPAFALAWARLSQQQLLYYTYQDRTEARLAKARAALERATRLDSLGPKVQLARGYYYYFALADYDRALRVFDELRKLEQNDSEVLWMSGIVHRLRGEWDEAERLLKRATELDPRSQVYAEVLGATYLFLHRFSEAERSLNRAIAIAPDWSPAYLMKAHVLISWRGDTAAAREAVHEAFRKVPFDVLAQILLSRFPYLTRMLGGDILDSVARFQIARSPGDSVAYLVARAWWHRAHSRPNDARASFELAASVGKRRLRRAPEDPMLNVLVGFANSGLGRRAETMEAAQRTASLPLLQRDAYFRPMFLGHVVGLYADIGERQSAIELLRALASQPSPLTPAMMRVDPHLIPLRQDPAFIALSR